LDKLKENNIETIRNKVSSTLKLDYGIEPKNGGCKKHLLSQSLERKLIVSYEIKKEDFITEIVDVFKIKAVTVSFFYI
jgi:hypothetical protein